MRFMIIAALACLPALAADKPKDAPALTDAQKLSIRNAQVEVLAAQLDITRLQARLQEAQGRLSAAVEDAKKTRGGDVTNELACAPKADAKKEK